MLARKPPAAASATTGRAAVEPRYLPADLDPVRDPMAGPRRERQSAVAQIDRSLKAWRAVKGGGGPAQREVEAPASGGRPMETPVRARMERQLNADLSSVRIHTGGDSARATDDLGARAFTQRDDVHFNHDEFAPGSKEGDRLLAHELTHVVQGRNAGVQRKAEDEADVSQPEEPAEREADQVADVVADSLHAPGRGRTAPAVSAARPTVARKHKHDDKKHDKHGKDPTLTEHDYEDLSYTLINYADYADADAQPVKPQETGVNMFDFVGSQVLLALQMAHADDSAQRAAGLQTWKAVEPTLIGLQTHAQLANTKGEYLEQLARAIKTIGDFIVERCVGATLDERSKSGDSLVGAPDDAMAESELADAPEALKELLELLEKTNEVAEVYADKLGGEAEGGEEEKAGAREGVGKKVGASALKGSIATIGLVLEVMIEGGEVEEQIKTLQERGQITKKIATGLDLVEFVTSVTSKGLTVVAEVGKALGALKNVGNAAAAFEEIGEAASSIGEAAEAIGNFAAVVAIAADAFKLVDAIQRGDDKGAASAAIGIAAGGWGLFTTAVGAGAGVAASSAAYFLMWEGFVTGALDNGAQMRGFDQDVKKQAVLRFVESAANVAEKGKRMSAAWQLSEEWQQDGSVAAKFANEATALATEVGEDLQGLGAMVRSQDKQEVGGYDDLVDQLGNEAVDVLGHGVELDGDQQSAMLLTFDCKKVFDGIDRMVKWSLKADAQGDMKLVDATGDSMKKLLGENKNKEEDDEEETSEAE